MKKTDRHLKPLSSFFQKYQKTLTAPEASVIDCFVEVVDDVLGISIQSKYIKYTPQTRTLSLTVGGPLKSEIKLHQTEILNHVKGRLGSKNTPTSII